MTHLAPAPGRLSPPREQVHVLLLGGVADSDVHLPSRAGYINVTRRAGALQDVALAEALPGCTCSVCAAAAAAA